MNDNIVFPSFGSGSWNSKESMTYAFTAAETFQLCCFSSFPALLLSDCVTDVNSEIALFCAELWVTGIVEVRFGIVGFR